MGKGRVFDVFLGSAAGVMVVLLIIGIIQSYVPIKTSTFQVPIRTDKTSYRLGDVVRGTFYGEVFTTVRPVIGRTLICDKQRQALTDFVVTNSSPEKIDGRLINIVELSDQSLKVGGVLEPDTDCIVQFAFVYSYPRILGAPRIEQVTLYTTPFDITAGDTAVMSDASGASTTRSTSSVAQSSTSTDRGALAASPRPTVVITPEPAPTPGQESLLKRIIDTVTGAL